MTLQCTEVASTVEVLGSLLDTYPEVKAPNLARVLQSESKRINTLYGTKYETFLEDLYETVCQVRHPLIFA